VTKRRSVSAAVRLTALIGSLVALALPIASASAARVSGHAVRVLSGNGRVVATFTSAKCKIVKGSFFSDAYDNGYHLEADVIPFDKFKRYKLARGHFTPQVVRLISPSGVHYASDYVPPYPVHGGGAIDFSTDGMLMGVGFSPMFSEDGSKAVTVTGVLTCHYPKKKGKH
jgi:hypothetical protein